MAFAKPPDQPRRRRWSRSVRMGIFLALAAIFVIGGVSVPWRWRGVAPPDGATPSWSRSGVDPSYSLYVGDRACSECHPGEAAHHSRSGHSRTLRPAAGITLARELNGLATEDPERPGVIWKYSLHDGQLCDRAHREGDSRSVRDRIRLWVRTSCHDVRVPARPRPASPRLPRAPSDVLRPFPLARS